MDQEKAVDALGSLTAIGAMLVSCPGNCQCDTKELEVIHLIFEMMTVMVRLTHSYQLQVAMVAMELLLLDIKIQTRRKDVQMV